MRTRDGLPFAHPGCPVTGKRAGKFIDTGQTQRLGQKMVPLIIHEAGARLLGRHIGMVDRDARSVQDEELISLRKRCEQLELENDELNAELDGIEGLTKRGLVIRKLPGRPPKNKE